MTKTEMTELFAVMSLAWPQAEMFRGGVDKLGPTIALWTACLQDLDAWTAQKAMVKLCRECKFPPAIAELREAADAVNREIQGEVQMAYLYARNAVQMAGTRGETLEEVYKGLPVRSQKVIDAMGGMEAFAPPDKPFFNASGFETTYEKMLRSNPAGLPGGNGGGRKQLPR